MIRLYKQSDGTLISIDESSQKSTMPTASADYVGKIYQYIGLTTLTYTNGYFYKCVLDTSTTPTTYKWEQVDVQPGGDGVLTMSKADFDAAKTAGTLPHNQTIIIPDDNGDVTNQIWIGTTAEHTAAETADTLPYNAIIGITENDGSGIKWYSRDDEGTETPFGSGGGSATRELKEISTANDFRIASGAYSFVTTTAVTITLADASTITIPANTIGFFDISETDETLDDYTGIIQYKANDRDKIIYFNGTSFTLPSTDNVEIDDTTASTTSTYSSSKIETVIGSSRASQMTGATSYQDGKAGLATQPKAGDNQKFLCGDGKYHTIYSADTGSTIIVVTDEPTLYNRPVSLTAGATTLTGTFDSTGECAFRKLALYGAVQVESTDSEDNPARGSTNLTYFGTYVVGIGFNFATLKLTSSDISFAGVPVAIYYNGEVVAETSLRVNGYGDLEAIAYVEKPGKYKAVAVGSEKTARASVTVTALRQTFTETLVSGYLPGSDRDNVICEAYGDNFVDGSLSWGDGTSPVAFNLNGGTVTPTLQEDNSVYIPVASNNVFASVDLGAPSTPFTAYAVIKMQNPSQYARLISSFSARSAGSGIMLEGNNDITITSWGSNTATGVSPLNYVVVAMQFIEPGVGRGFVRGYAQVYADKPSQTAGRYVTIGRTDIEQGGTDQEPCNVFVKYFAVVDEVENVQTVQANMEYLNTMFLDE